MLAGVPTEPLLSKAGLTLDEMLNHAVRFRVRDQIAFLNLAARALKDEFLGFHLAQHVELREVGLLYYVLSSSENLKDALERASRYSGIVNEGVVQEFVAGKHHRMSVRYVGVSRHPDRHQIEFWMGCYTTCRKSHPYHSRSVRFVHMRKVTMPASGVFWGQCQIWCRG